MPPQATWLTKLKVQLKLAIARLRMVQQRDEQIGKTHRRAMAQLLEAGKVDSATIRVEGIIRADITSELHELLELFCELLLARAGLLDGSVCDAGLEEAVKSLIFAAPKTEIKELVTVRTLLAEKYGKEFVLAAMENADGKVNDKVVKKLGVEPPRKELVQGYLEEIAKAYGVDWPKRERATPPPPPPLLDDDGDEDAPPSGAQAVRIEDDAARRRGSLRDEEEDLTRATPPRARLGNPLTVTPPRMTTENVHPKITLGSVELRPGDGEESGEDNHHNKIQNSNKTGSGGRREPEGAVPDISDLEKRFAALKRR